MHESEKLWNKQYIFMLSANVFCAFSFYMITTILSKYVIGAGYSLAVSGVVVGAFSVTSMVIRPFTGYLSDHLNKKKLLIAANIFCTAAVFGYIITENIAVIMACRILHGIGFGISSTVVVAEASGTIPKEKTGEGIGYLGLGQVFASAVAPGIGIAIMEKLNMSLSFIVSGLIAFMGVVFVSCYRQKERDVEQADTRRKRVQVSDFLLFGILHFTGLSSLYSFINGVIAAYLLLFAEERGIGTVSVYFTVCAVTLFLIRPLTGKLMDQKGLRFVVYPAVILTALSMFLLGSASSLGMILFSGVLRSLGQGAAQPALQAACIKKAGREKAGVATSTYYLGGDIGQGIGPMLGGVAATAFGYGNLFRLCGILLFAGLSLFALGTWKKKLY